MTSPHCRSNSYVLNDLKGCFGIVTGAASGIGQATAIHLARMGAGVSLVDLDGNGLEKTKSIIQEQISPAPLIFQGDVTDESQVKKVAAETATAFETIDFLINCAGVLKRTSFLEIQTDEWDSMLNVNLRGPFLYCQAIVPYMIDQGKGVIINVSSLAGRSSSILGGAHYTTAKHALIGLSRHLARELSPLGLRVNAFCPGATFTPMITAKASAQEIEAIAAAIPRQKWAAPEEQAAVIGFLVSDAAVNITGACIDSNGGSLMI